MEPRLYKVTEQKIRLQVRFNFRLDSPSTKMLR
jgi:hypothetical protein